MNKEYWIELESGPDGKAMVYCEPVDGLNKDAVHVIEYSAYQVLLDQIEGLEDKTVYDVLDPME